ncbi:trans-Golgi network integral membrane protein 1-like isoform X2 [Pogonomyrmex barbatus]|uniref:Trans-Golgi network integral membrane protein 1-like isoform X2 n=1 Tax=Pogonomyrmex barbatus TaxID=144034 RepID=A0A6I9XCE2_9HYME|nr:trans-Golgi network integral membrane protein 1-like isoform X2 [Pogonomyrmex barbatus]
MGNRYAHLFCIMPNCFILFVFFTGVKSAPMKPSVIDIIKNDTKLCPTSKILYESDYIKPCASMAYPNIAWNYKHLDTLSNFLCVGVYDTAYKICEYSSRLQISLNSTATFDAYVEKYVVKYPSEDKNQKEFCNNLQGFTSVYKETSLLWGPLVKNLGIPHKCMKICFDFKDKFHPLCAVFAWIKSIDNIQKANKIEKYDLTSSDKPSMTDQSKDETIKIISNKSKTVPQAKEFKDEDRERNVKSGEVKSDTEKLNNIQKKKNITESQAHKSASSVLEENKDIGDIKLETNPVITNSTKNFPASNDLLSTSIKNTLDNISHKKVVNEENTEKLNKEQDIEDLKTSTLSENTQDHYDAENPEEDMENNMDDVDDTNQHPVDIGNQNGNVQETFEQKNNARLSEYSNIRTEDDSHFFTYLTIITLACLAGYVGYHNKQKIFAIVLEGRRSRSNRSRRRPSTANYRKLDCTLEEAVTSQCNANVTHVIY